MEIKNFKPSMAKECCDLMIKNEKFLGDLYTPRELTKAAEYNQYWVAEDEGKIVGLAGLADLHNGIGMGISICVDPDTQGKGVGTALIRKIVDYAKKEKFRKVLFLINAKNKRMMGLAIKEDFVPEGSLQKHFRTGEDVIYFSYFV